MPSTLVFYAQFVDRATPAAGVADLSPTIDVSSVDRSNGTVAAAVTGGSMTQISSPNKRGLYFYRLTSADPRTYDYVGVAVTADATVAAKHVPALWSEFSPSALKALPDAAAGANLGLPLNDANGLVGGNVQKWLDTNVRTVGDGTPAVAVVEWIGHDVTVDANNVPVVSLAAAQPAYAPAKAGDAMALTGGERTTLAGDVRDVSNAAPAAGSLGADVAAAAVVRTTVVEVRPITVVVDN